MMYEDDDEAAADDAEALRVVDRLVSAAAERGLFRGAELDEARRAAAQLRSLVEDWHGTAHLLLSGAPAGSA
jgi:hypothetical protein